MQTQRKEKTVVLKRDYIVFFFVFLQQTEVEVDLFTGRSFHAWKADDVEDNDAIDL